MEGTIVKSGELGDKGINTLTVKDLIPGTYIMQIKNANNVISKLRFIKQ